MDLQMPVMDGLTATREIRHLESNRQLEPTPILAFTANAGGPDVLRSLVAGCNAHITKPISKPALLAALEQYGVAAPADDPRQGVESTELKALVPNYVAARQRDLERIATLIESRNFGEIRKLVHDVKGTGKAYGFPKLTKLASAMQASAETSDPAALERQFAEMADYLWRKSAC
jgi:response regulator RpfG family c-di-GMP phosphodiesterase